MTQLTQCNKANVIIIKCALIITPIIQLHCNLTHSYITMNNTNPKWSATREEKASLSTKMTRHTCQQG